MSLLLDEGALADGQMRGRGVDAAQVIDPKHSHRGYVVGLFDRTTIATKQRAQTGHLPAYGATHIHETCQTVHLQTTGHQVDRIYPVSP